MAAGSGSSHKPAGTPGLVAWALYDWGSNAFAALIQTFVFAAYFTRSVAESETAGSAQWGSAVGTAGLVIALGGPILGAVADQGGRRKPYLLAFTLLCVAATASLWLIRPDTSYVWPALVLVAVGTIGAEYAMIFYNAMLAGLAPPERLGRWSGWGWGAGYAGGLICLVLALFVFIRPEPALFGLDRDSAEHVRATFLLAAGWYLVFALPALIVTPDTQGTGKRLARAARDGMRQLVDSLRRVRAYAHIVRFLIARLLFIDGLTTVFAFGGVYAAGAFDMDEQQVLTFGIVLNVTAGLGAFGFAWLDDFLGSKRTIVLGLVGLLTTGSLILAVQSATLFWIFGAALGVFVGPVQAAGRSYLASEAPEHLRNEMFGLFAFSGKATAFAGPFLVGWVSQLAGSQRIGMTTILVFFAAGLALMLTVPEARRARRGN